MKYIILGFEDEEPVIDFVKKELGNSLKSFDMDPKETRDFEGCLWLQCWSAPPKKIGCGCYEAPTCGCDPKEAEEW